MPKYCVKNYFTHGRFPEVGQKQKTEKERKRERAKVGDNNGQAAHGARKPPGTILPSPVVQYSYCQYNCSPSPIHLTYN